MVVVAEVLINNVASISYFVDMLAEVVVDPLIDALTGVIMVFVPDIDVEVLAGANANGFASLMTAVEFAMTKPLGQFSSC